ncbi:unnamed protein product [Paramecium pentaurelia]|uniref:Uncharacterized protein n=1 Tax=Paramecium pentaurelia TaxID=43138 RepID=A0A8S1XBX6_9CILI|nr:unnamed protein product [Paramecium pentaurelia]
MSLTLNLGYVPTEIASIKGDLQILYKTSFNLLVMNGKWLQDINTFNCSINHQVQYNTFAQHYKPVKVTYSKKYDIYFILFDDWQIYILSSNLVFFNKISVITSYPISIQFIDESISLYVVQDSKIEQIFMEIKKTSLQIKVILLNKLCFTNSNKYFIGFQLQHSLIFLWEQTTLKVYSQNYQLISEKLNITNYKNSITCLLYFPTLYYIICGTKDGKIYTWTLYNQNQPINIFELEHGSNVDQLQNDKNDENMFWASSNNEISLYSIQTWQCLQIYKIGLQYKNIFIINQYRLFASFQQSFYILNRQLEQRLLYQHKSDIRCLIEGISDPQFLFDNNSLIQMLNPNKFNTHYIKTKQTIIQAHFIQETYYFLTETSDILKFQDETINIVISSDHLHNSEGALVKNKIINLKFIEIDSNLIYLFVYIQQGQILLFKLPNFNRSISELNYNRCSIKLSTIFKALNNDICILTIDEHNVFKLLKMKDNNIQLLKQLNFKIEIKKWISLLNNIFILTNQGELNIFKYHNDDFQQQIIEIEGDEYYYNDFQVYLDPKIIIGSQAQMLVLMSFKKIILRQINLDSILLNYGYFNKNLILCLQNELSVIEDQRLQFTHNQLKEINSNRKIIEYCGFEIFEKGRDKIHVSQKEKSIQLQKNDSIQTKKQIKIQSNTIKVITTSEKQPIQKNQHITQSSFYNANDSTQRGRIKSRNQQYQDNQQNQSNLNITATQYRPWTQNSFNKTKQHILQQSSSVESNQFKELDALYQPAIPLIKQTRKNTLTEQFIESRLKKKKFKTRRDLTMNKIVQRNIKILSFC